MAKKAAVGSSFYRGHKPGKTSISKKRRSTKFSTMNKSKKRSWKEYRGQGR